MVSAVKGNGKKEKAKGIIPAYRRDFVRNRYIYLMLLPVVAYFIIFHYIPLFGAQIAFRDFSPQKGLFNSPWAGFRHFKDFFGSYYFTRLVRNTVLINIYDIIFGFPAPIILALLLNEIRVNFFKRIVQTVTYLPHFISVIVICGMIKDFFSRQGVINSLLGNFGIQSIAFMTEPGWFRPLFVGSNIWTQIGWGSIIYLAALTNIDQELYEAATIDGARRFKQLIHITLPCIVPTIVVMFILRIGRIMTVGFEKVLLLYNENTYETADVISSFVYRKGILEMSYSYSTAVSLFNSAINFTMLVIFNKICKKISENSLW
jgi:putative aldouronate transport system permease protein